MMMIRSKKDFQFYRMKNVIVIGSGALGLCTAYFLRKKGVKVSVISASKKNDEMGCSFGNAGMIVPSHFTPLAAPGVIKDALKWLLDSKGPLYIKPRMNADLVAWMWKFLKSANAKNVERSSELLLNLNSKSRDLFHDISVKENIDFEYHKQGLMMLYKSAKYQDEEEQLALKAKEMGIDVEILDQKAIQDHEKDLGVNALGGVWYKSDAHIIPHQFMIQLREILELNGINFIDEVSIDRINHRNNLIQSIESNGLSYEADEFVLCTGAWSQSLVKQLGINIPIQGGKGYHLHSQNVPHQLKTPSILCEARIAMTPMQNDLRISGTMEIAGLDLSINKNRVEGIKENAVKYFDKLSPDYFEGLKPWAGLRPVSPDGLPYVGRSSKYQNFLFNTGHAMMGLSLAPVCGSIISELIFEEQSEFPLTVFSPDRFG